VPSDDYLKKVRAWCDEQGLLLILDEVQTGIGRTGTLYAYQQYGAEPDIMTLAKGLGGGVPIGAFLAKEQACVFKIGEHGTTFGGNPLVCAVAFDVLDYIISQDLAGHTGRMGEYLCNGLRKLAVDHTVIKEVRGKGLLVALQFNSGIAESVVLACLGKGIIVNKVKPDVIRFIPPLIVKEKDIDRALDVLGSVLKERQ
jgi:acetylornithine/succinyldiaminopimelate/putrescine aminotransferase